MLQQVANRIQLARFLPPRASLYHRWGQAKVTSMIGVAGRFAQTVMNRYRGLRGRQLGVGLIFRQVRWPQVPQPMVQQTHVTWAPRLAVTLLALSPPEPQLYPVQVQGMTVVQPSVRQRVPLSPKLWFQTQTHVMLKPMATLGNKPSVALSASLPPQVNGRYTPKPETIWRQRRWQIETSNQRVQETQRISVKTREQLTYRLVKHRERVEMRSAQRPSTVIVSPTMPEQGSTSIQTAQPTPMVTAVPRVMRQANPVITEGVPATPQPHHQQSMSPHPLAPMNQTPLTNKMPIDINSLTNQIVKTIDQRIVAQRERMGRM